MDPILGQIILWPMPWVPQGWALCDGTLVGINQNQALFALLGVTYGGNGTTNFALPDLRNRVPMGTQSMTAVGQVGGAASATVAATGAGSVTIGLNNLPAHTHAATFTPGGGSSNVDIAIPVDATNNGDNNTPGNTLVLGKGLTGNTPAKVYSSAAANTTLKPFSVSVPAGGGTVANANAGGGQALPISVSVPVTVPTIQPFVTLNYIIATSGIFPSRP